MQRIASTTISEITQATSRTARGCIFFLHGSCDNGSGLKSWLHKVLNQDFTFKTCRVLYPTAPKLSYLPHGNKHESVWFNRLSFDHNHDAPEDLGSINHTANELSRLILEEHKTSEIPLSKMVIGGFSSGGAMALHLGYRYHPQIAGVFTLSSYVPSHSIIFDHLEQRRTPEKPLVIEKPSTKTNVSNTVQGPLEDSLRKPPPDLMGPFIQKYLTKKDEKLIPQMPKLFMSQGFEDPLVKAMWGKSTFKKLRTFGVDGLFYSHPKKKHDICKTQLNLLHLWIEDVLNTAEEPPSSTNSDPSPHSISTTKSYPTMRLY